MFIFEADPEPSRSTVPYHRSMSERNDAPEPGYPSGAELLITPEALSARLAAEAGEATEAAAAEAADDLAGGEQGARRAPAPRTRVLDVRWSLANPAGHADYLAGHIPGAVYVDLESELSDVGPATAGRHPLPGGAALTDSARRWGLNPGDTVVAYDGGGNFAAARLWWVLRDAGFANVALLDGALAGWIAAGLPLEQSAPAPTPGTVRLRPGHSPTLSLEAAGRFAQEHALLDARAPERFAGESEPIDPVAGHIPGARNLPTSGNVDAHGRFLSPRELRDRFAGVGVSLDGEPAASPRVGIYCGSGITASHALFALALAGGEGALFPGSWSQWSNHPELPVETGHTP
ncbi:sulfurtransferase [Nonlabens tegetincola]